MNKKEKPMYRFLTSVVVSLIIFGALVLILGRGIMHYVSHYLLVQFDFAYYTIV